MESDCILRGCSLINSSLPPFPSHFPPRLPPGGYTSVAIYYRGKEKVAGMDLFCDTLRDPLKPFSSALYILTLSFSPPRDILDKDFISRQSLSHNHRVESDCILGYSIYYYSPYPIPSLFLSFLIGTRFV